MNKWLFRAFMIARFLWRVVSCTLYSVVLVLGKTLSAWSAAVIENISKLWVELVEDLEDGIDGDIDRTFSYDSMWLRRDDGSE